MRVARWAFQKGHIAAHPYPFADGVLRTGCRRRAFDSFRTDGGCGNSPTPVLPRRRADASDVPSFYGLLWDLFLFKIFFLFPLLIFTGTMA